MRPSLITAHFFLSLSIVCSSSSSAAPLVRKPAAKKNPFERVVSAQGFRGRIALRPVSEDRVEVLVKSARGITVDTVRGHAIFPVLVEGKKQPFYFGKFGTSKFPMLVFAVSDPERVQDSHVLGYQISPSGALIGQQVIADETTKHGHTDDMSGGRYQLASINPDLGAIYSVSYQDAKFDGFFVSYEKLRVRQWDPTINAFIETDQGFLREKNGKLVESAKFHNLDDKRREEVFTTNLRSWEAPTQRAHTQPRVVPVSLSTQTSRR
jgi:hypothetical protein